MNRLNMFLQISLFCSLMVTLIARIFNFFVYRLIMCLKMWLCRSLIVTLITRIFDFFMNRLNMSLQISLLCKLMIAQITRVFDFLMNRLNMSLQISLICSLMVTLITRIFDFCMNRLNMSLQISLCCSLVVTSIITLGLPTASLYILIIHPTPNHLVTILSSVLAVQSLVLQNRHLVNVNLAEYWRECRLFLYRNSSCVFFFLKGRRLKRTW